MLMLRASDVAIFHAAKDAIAMRCLQFDIDTLLLPLISSDTFFMPFMLRFSLCAAAARRRLPLPRRRLLLFFCISSTLSSRCYCHDAPLDFLCAFVMPLSLRIHTFFYGLGAPPAIDAHATCICYATLFFIALLSPHFDAAMPPRRYARHYLITLLVFAAAFSIIYAIYYSPLRCRH